MKKLIALILALLLGVVGASSFFGSAHNVGGVDIVPPQYADLGYEVYDVTLKNDGVSSAKAFTLYNNGFPVLFAKIVAVSNSTTFPVETSPVAIPPDDPDDPDDGVGVYIRADGITPGEYTVTYLVSATDTTLQWCQVYITFTGNVTVETPSRQPLSPP